ncbi:MAG: signal peptidase I [Enterococcus sp.]
MKKEWLQMGIFFISVTLFVLLLRHFIFTPVVVRGDSMNPTIHNGEHVIALKHLPVERFDIVTFPAPDQAGENYIKRVIGLPGETVAYENDHLLINGQEVAEPYLNELKKQVPTEELLTYDFTMANFGVTKIPEGEVLVLGDNRQISKDSRSIGFIKEAQISGNVKFSFWPIHEVGLIDSFS